MANYKGLATITLVADGTRYDGTAILHTTQNSGRIDWRGSFTASDGSPVNTGAATIEIQGRSASVLVTDWRFSEGQGTAVLLGQNEPPF